MKLSLNIDLSNQNAIAFLNYMRTLDFVSISNNELNLSEQQKASINEGLTAVNNGHVTDHIDVMNETKIKYPNLFSK